MADLPAGTIALRDDRLGTTWQVSVSAFRLARSPVTGADGVPRTGVSWFEAVAMCNELSLAAGLTAVYGIDGEDVSCDWRAPGYRLPTEAEWQYACTSGVPAYRYGPLDEIAWYGENSGGRVQRVGRKTPNAWGLHDMLGNIWEWCWDLYDPVDLRLVPHLPRRRVRRRGPLGRLHRPPPLPPDLRHRGPGAPRRSVHHGLSAIFPTVARASSSASALGPSARS